MDNTWVIFVNLPRKRHKNVSKKFPNSKAFSNSKILAVNFRGMNRDANFLNPTLQFFSDVSLVSFC
jgi:hypothetical protein